jgi:Helix-turn-helix
VFADDVALLPGAIERGEFNVTPDNIVKMARALDVSVATLLKRAKL